jgi:hypothetical protein
MNEIHLTVILNNGLEKIGWEAFRQCSSLKCIKIPNAVKVIKEGTFDSCSQLWILTLGNGLDEIGHQKCFARHY